MRDKNRKKVMFFLILLVNIVVLGREEKVSEEIIEARFRRYQKTMIYHGRREKIPMSLIYGIIKVESKFNSKAKSHKGAYGLMQIVPRSAGYEITKHIEGKKRRLTKKELYHPHKNIRYGVTYLGILYHKYFRAIKNRRSRIYCTIAAYNTGPGNLARAFTKGYNPHKAALVINKMSSQQVYNRLLRHLPYRETKYYLVRTRKYMREYERRSKKR